MLHLERATCIYLLKLLVMVFSTCLFGKSTIAFSKLASANFDPCLTLKVRNVGWRRVRRYIFFHRYLSALLKRTSFYISVISSQLVYKLVINKCLCYFATNHLFL